MHVKVRSRSDAGPDRGLLLAAQPGTAHPGGGRADRAARQGHRGSRAAPPAVAGRLPLGRRGVRVRPQRRVRPLPAHDQPPPEGAARRGAPRPREARGVGLLPPQRRSPRRRRVAPRRRHPMNLARRAGAELVGTAFLVMAVIGSGIAASRLSPHDVGLQLLANSLVTGAALVALILALQPVSASFNPVVTLAERALGAIGTSTAGAQVAGGLVGVVTANLMFGLPAVTVSGHHRTGGGLWLGDVVATLGLVVV